MLVAEDLKKKLIEAVQTGSFPANGITLSNAIRSYVMANGTALAPTISYTLSPCSGAGWTALIAKASSTGVAEYIINTVISVEFAASTKVIPAPHGVQTVPMVFNSAAQVSNLSKAESCDEVWGEIAKAIIKFFETEIK